MTETSDIDGTLELKYVVFADGREVNGIEVEMEEHHIPTFRDHMDEIDGVAVYEAEYTRAPVREGEEGEQGPFTHTYRQPFAEDAGPKGKQVNGRNVWAWDGDKENPTLKPSFGSGQLDLDDGWVVHLFLENGKIRPCGDMALEVEQS